MRSEWLASRSAARLARMIGELDVLRIVSERLDEGGFGYMLTGSFAMAYYATPRMTRDLDLVVELAEGDLGQLVSRFDTDFYLDAAAVEAAVRSRRLFNLMHLESGIKVDFIVAKSDEYRRLEFSRRQRVKFGPTEIFIVSREDLILSKLVWALDTDSELQRRDVRVLMQGPEDCLDRDYVSAWSVKLGVDKLLEAILAERNR